VQESRKGRQVRVPSSTELPEKSDESAHSCVNTVDHVAARGRTSLLTGSRRSPFAAFLAFALLVPAAADERTYREAFLSEVLEFATLNRLNISRLHRDVHANCYIPVTVATTVLQDGSVKDIAIVNSSSVPVVDRYIRFVIEQAAPFPTLATHYDPAPDEVRITHEFRLDASLWGDGVRSERPCQRPEPPDPRDRQ
jgi:hypothetical protein